MLAESYVSAAFCEWYVSLFPIYVSFDLHMWQHSIQIFQLIPLILIWNIAAKQDT